MTDEEKAKKLAEELKRLTGSDEISWSVDLQPVDDKLVKYMSRFPDHMNTKKHKMTDYDSKTAHENQ